MRSSQGTSGRTASGTFWIVGTVVLVVLGVIGYLVFTGDTKKPQTATDPASGRLSSPPGEGPQPPPDGVRPGSLKGTKLRGARSKGAPPKGEIESSPAKYRRLRVTPELGREPPTNVEWGSRPPIAIREPTTRGETPRVIGTGADEKKAPVRLDGVQTILFPPASDGGEELLGVIFSHSSHARLGCKECAICHNGKVFANDKALGLNDIAMDEIYEGKWCGYCHNGELLTVDDRPVFAPRSEGVDQCVLCHNAKPWEKTEDP